MFRNNLKSIRKSFSNYFFPIIRDNNTNNTVRSLSLLASSNWQKQDERFLLRKNNNSIKIINSRSFTDNIIEQLELPTGKPLLRRAILYVPGNDQRKIDKALKNFQTIDSIVLDCEDGVAINKKEDARQTIVKILDEYGSNESLWEKLSVRINSIDSNLAADDLNIILSGKYVPRTILLPKVDQKSDIDQFADYLQKALNKRPKKSDDNDNNNDIIDLITYVESARGLLDLRELCQHTLEMCEFTKYIFSGIVFGSDDFCASIGAQRSDEGKEILMARQQVILIAKSMNLQAIDAVYINYRDLDGLKRQSEEGCAMGFTGKQCIHPDQVPIIQDAFGPSQEKISWAKGLIEEFEQAQKSGKGAFVYQGQMIDMPLLKQAYNIVNFSKQIDKTK